MSDQGESRSRKIVEAHRAEQKRVKANRDGALERADRREWANARLGDEHRWQETIATNRKSGARRFMFDPVLGEVVEID